MILLYLFWFCLLCECARERQITVDRLQMTVTGTQPSTVRARFRIWRSFAAVLRGALGLLNGYHPGPR